ncbi:hypothetical protein AAY473_002486 [Plecturocebus cupreus]
MHNVKNETTAPQTPRLTRPSPVSKRPATPDGSRPPPRKPPGPSNAQSKEGQGCREPLLQPHLPSGSLEPSRRWSGTSMTPASRPRTREPLGHTVAIGRVCRIHTHRPGALSTGAPTHPGSPLHTRGARLRGPRSSGGARPAPACEAILTLQRRGLRPPRGPAAPGSPAMALGKEWGVMIGCAGVGGACISQSLGPGHGAAHATGTHWKMENRHSRHQAQFACRPPGHRQP